MRVIAIDWSGALDRARQKIWLAEATNDGLIRLKNGRSREEIAKYLVGEVERDSQIVIGFDFAFSLPAWFLKELGLSSAQEMWQCAERKAETWLAESEPPFWGRKGRPKPAEDPNRDQFRLTDRDVPSTGGIKPKSVFQVGGAGAVGTGSLRGMPILNCLKAAGFSIWPFDNSIHPLVVEIYPRLLTGPVNKGNIDARAEYLEASGYKIDRKLYLRAVCSEDAFDAAVSALVMYKHYEDLRTLPNIQNQQVSMEGLIWHPCWRSPPEID